MTKGNTPIQIPMSKTSRAEAKDYIKKCLEGENGYIFEDFEHQVREYTLSLQTGTMMSSYSFVEYVIKEVIMRNQKVIDPPRNCGAWVADVMMLHENRAEALYLFGANPKYFADIHYDLINAGLIEAEMPHSFACCLDWKSWVVDRARSGTTRQTKRATTATEIIKG